MVQVRQQTLLDEQGAIDLIQWLEQLPLVFDNDDRARLLHACELVRLAQQKPAVDTGDWAWESNCLIAGLDITIILADLHVDIDCLIAGVLYRAVREGRLGPAQVRIQFGDAVTDLIEGVLRMAAISDLPMQTASPVLGQAHDQKDNIRKMLIALVDDVRVALIKLAERTCAIRSVKEDEERRRQIGQEVFDVYAPLAHRLGIGHLKWELEDLSFRYTHAESYRKIARLLDSKRLERDRFIAKVTEELTEIFRSAGLQFTISGRAKHIYSIWRKMQRKGIGFSQVYDIRAVRILVPETKDCYATLGLVHSLWLSIPNEFDDYIANPKENAYRSLHTTVVGPEGKTLEVQIRTENMDFEAELGVCAHWRYKGSDAVSGLASTYEEKIAWLRQVLDWHEEAIDARGVTEQFNFSVAQDRVYTFTPDGDVVNLAYGATPLDFAYHVHTEIGHRCRGAKVNGALVPLTYQLQTGERVEILTSSEAHPRRDWLQPGLGYIKTSRARAKVQFWFKSQTREDNIDTGRHLLKKEFKRLALTSVDYQRIAMKVQLTAVEDMFAAVGSGDLTSVQVLNAAQDVVDSAPEPHLRLNAALGSNSRNHVDVRGVGSLHTRMAGCCKPLPGDEIIGYVTKGKGVSIHRVDCARLLKLQESVTGRVVETAWGEGPEDNYEVDVAIEAYDRQGLLSDITGLFANARINVLTINTQTNRQTNTAIMKLRVEVPDLGSLSKLLERIDRLKNVVSVVRVSD
tara:strand:- start:1864 stop:4092 length:2229 start_codon:yes stop_codon:yes gene_type:complete